MGFTRSTTETDVHSTLGDYPNVDDGLTPAQLKARFDSPATGLKSDINGLEGELEAATAAINLGADKITESDESDANIQAKLNKIYLDMQEIVAGEVPDNSITEAKLASDYTSAVAKKDGTLQTNLNADKLGGQASSNYALKNGTLQTNLNAEKLGNTTLAALITRLSGYFTTGTVVISNNTSQAVGGVISLGYTPSLIVLANFPTSASGSYGTRIGLIFSGKLIYLGTDSKYYSKDITVSGGAVTIPKGMDSGTYNYIAFKSSL